VRILIVDTYYPAFLRAFAAQASDRSDGSYRDLWRALMSTCFAAADFYSFNLRSAGHEATEIVANYSDLQRRWARENAPDLFAAYALFRAAGRLDAWQRRVLARQVSRDQPDVLYVQDPVWVGTDLLRQLKPRVGLVVGQVASNLPTDLDLSVYDLMLSSFPPYVDRFRAAGLDSEYLKLAFEPRILPLLGEPKIEHRVSFIGGHTALHESGTALLEKVAAEFPVEFWGYGVESLPPDSVIRRQHRGAAWGLEMYRIFAASKVVLNRHIDLAGGFANNMRLFEATGAGACLLTDQKDNLADLFRVGTEVASYGSAEECLEALRFLMPRDAERQAIARAGQARTLRDHNYEIRMQELADLLRPRVPARRGPLPARRQPSPQLEAFSPSEPSETEPARHSGRVLIRPSSGWPSLGIREIWEYRELLYFLTWRDVKVRYKQAVLGAAWAIIQPLLAMIVFTLLFGRLGQVPSDGLPYPIFVYSALVPWQLFAHALSESGNSLVLNQNLLTKVYFPRVLIPMAAILSGLLDFFVAFLLLVVLMVHYGFPPQVSWLTLPMFVLLLLATALAVGLWLSALNVRYRDIRYTIPFLVQLWLFCSPVAYPTTVVPAKWRLIYGLNPMTGVIEGFRWALFRTPFAPTRSLVISCLVILVVAVLGLGYFRRTEKTFADFV
jgi:lipopolysaccharide transport system permease protein